MLFKWKEDFAAVFQKKKEIANNSTESQKNRANII